METAIKLTDISKRFGNISALNGISFGVNRGEIFGYLGPNGAGKTTTIRILLGLIRPDKGNYEIFNGAGKPLPPEKIGFVLERDGLLDRLNARQNLFFYGKIYKVKEIEQKISQMLKIFSIPDSNQQVGTFSKGMRKRLALARALIHEPEVLILDEPTAGLDPLGQVEIQKLILQLSKDKKITIFLTSHNLDEIERICDSVAILCKGELKFRSSLKEVSLKGKSLQDIYCYFVGEDQ